MDTPAWLCDPRGLRLGTAVAAAADALETALGRWMRFEGPPAPQLQAAAAADPAWALPWVLLAAQALQAGEPGAAAQARAALAAARDRGADAPAREQGHLQAVLALAEGRWTAACQAWDDLLLEHPRDALALFQSQWWDLRRGDTAALLSRPAQVLPEWDPADPLYPQLLGLYAFGLQENRLHGPAEEVARRALSLEPRVPWAVHAVAHVMEAQGRVEDGTAWLRQQQDGWVQGELLAPHLWWHMGLFRLEVLDLPGVHRLLDAHLSGPALGSALARQDATTLLWRLHLLGEDVGARFTLLLLDWAPDPDEAGLDCFHDLHVLLVLLGADELVRAEQWLARAAARVMQAEDARRSHHAVAREVALPLLRGLLSLARGDAAAATASLRQGRPQWWRLGGSAVQRDVLDQTLVVAASRSPHRAVGRAVLNERRMARAATPLMRLLAERLGASA